MTAHFTSRDCLHSDCSSLVSVFAKLACRLAQYADSQYRILEEHRRSPEWAASQAVLADAKQKVSRPIMCTCDIAYWKTIAASQVGRLSSRPG